jgi:hypothetical protein
MRKWAAGCGLGQMLLVVAGVAGLGGGAVTNAAAQRPQGGPGMPGPVASTHMLQVGGTTLQVDFAAGGFDLPAEAILQHVDKAAKAVAAYYGKFPVAGARVLIVPVANDRGILQGTTWGGVRGWPAFTRLRIGQHTTQGDLDDDWMMTHELVHMAFPSLPDDQHWMEEGLSTYVEPVARVQTGELKAEQIWRDMVRDMGKGEPRDGDKGIDVTHTWGRTYWGGAMFCLMADVAIRRETHNKMGLQDALRAIVDQHGTINHDWDLPKALAMGDEATGTHVLMRQYEEWKDKPVTVDLPKLWAELGIKWVDGGTVTFDDAAPGAGIRKGITEKR